jgi:hypothetical protein
MVLLRGLTLPIWAQVHLDDPTLVGPQPAHASVRGRPRRVQRLPLRAVHVSPDPRSAQARRVPRRTTPNLMK